MNRRQFSKTVGAGFVGVAIQTAPPASKSKPRAAESEKKQWAREHLRGLGSLVMPSFSPDFKRLDEDGIRLDIRHRIRQGFCSTMISATGANAEQRKRIEEIVSEEIKGKMLRSVIVSGNPEAAIAALDNAAKAGVTHAMLTFPGSLKPETEDEVYAHYRKVVDATSLPIILYGRGLPSLRRFHPSGIPVNVYDRLADHPNVVGMKMTHAMPVGLAFELCERLSDRILMGPVNLDLAPILGRHYKNIQWSSQWISDAVQSPEKPYGMELFDLVSKGRTEQAMKVYWQMQPLIDLIYDVQARLLGADEPHPWQHMKYYQWVMGGNGGLLPLGNNETVPVLTAESRQRIRDTVKKVGIAFDRPDEEFMVGKTAYIRGVRASDLTSKPHYV